MTYFLLWLACGVGAVLVYAWYQRVLYLWEAVLVFIAWPVFLAVLLFCGAFKVFVDAVDRIPDPVIWRRK